MQYPWCMKSGSKAPFPQVPKQVSWPELEEEILGFWAQDKTFEASVEQRTKGENEFVFYDGPPFANGLPHYGHLLTGFVKDAIPRYETMRGKRVERRFGWDCHGLPAEMEAEKELNLAGRSQIIDMGVGEFNDYCRSLVQRTTDAWVHFVTRQARWVDFDNDYKTMDLSYMESVMWAFKKLHDKNLAYEGYRVLPYCWECETPLSNFETRQDDSYRLRQDPAVTVLFEYKPGGKLDEVTGGRKTSFVVWTTTPWTLPSNLALCVGPEISYSLVGVGDEIYVMATERLAAYQSQLGDLETLTEVARLKGSDLEGLQYQPMFPYFSSTPNAFKVLTGSFVGEEEGTGIVHIAPGFGEDDKAVSDANSIPTVCPVDDTGKFTEPVSEYLGLQVFEANPLIIKDLKAQGRILAHESYSHNYPHCWRTDTPLIYKAVSSWFIKVTAIKERMLELNREITWVPEHTRDGAFGKWLEGARDWSISRNRFWGAPIPVWKSDDPAYPRIDVYGSLDELEADFGVRPDNLHRPYIDDLVRPNPDDPSGKSTMRRVTDVMDCWFESGSMPFAQLHYPFENAKHFEDNFPADFIVEYTGQTRGWFYTLHVLSTALFDRPPFLNCIAHGVVLGNDGRKLSKRLKNYPDPQEVFDTIGSDAMRWFLISSPVLRGNDLVVDAKGLAEPIRSVLNPIWNAWYFLSLYANSDAIEPDFSLSSDDILDRYIVAKTSQLVTRLTEAMERYDLPQACGLVVSFMDALNNWYIRRSRDRFWQPGNAEEANKEKLDAFSTLSGVLRLLLTISAPLLPMVSERIYKDLTGERSVHLVDWPDVSTLRQDPDLVESMDLVREICSNGHSIRKARGLRSRLPLPKVTVAMAGVAKLAPYKDLVADELNVKEVELIEDVSSVAEHVLKVVPSVLGPRLGGDTQRVIQAVKQGKWTELEDGRIDASGIVLNHEEFELKLEPRDPDYAKSLPGADCVILLDAALSDELIAEGSARDAVRLIQIARKDMGLDISDRIHLKLACPSNESAMLLQFAQHIQAETLAETLDVITIADDAAGEIGGWVSKGELSDGQPIFISIEKAPPAG